MAWNRVVHLPSTDSTNTHLMRGLTTEPEAWPHLSALVAHEQTAGRGRAGRSWHSRPGASLTVSFVLRPDDGAPPTPWIPLLVGLAVRRALTPWVATSLKWPNDVLLATGADPLHNAGASDGGEWGWAPKLGGILCELHPTRALVAGVGINCQESPDELPVPWAASIASATGSSPDPAEVLDALGTTVPQVLADWASHPARVREEYEAASAVVGNEVAVGDVRGRAVGIADDGALLVETAGGVVPVTVGDVDRAR
ncbi:MAG TPA: biotin--[acetyl-CoA-carboxylase] ligase, partial [Actinomycetales bacterium]|nr:biotin--[acetyl-CoA-carboxylase] ligase [Actinomycetales bacterium]